VLAQIAAGAWATRRLLAVGMAALAAGLVLLVLAVWLPTPSLALFLVGGLVAGAGAGLLFKGGMTTVAGLASADNRAEVLAGYFLAAYLGLSVPVLGLGLLDRLVDARTALLVFAALLLAGIGGAARTLLADHDDGDGAPQGASGQKPRPSELRPTTTPS
jgi:MFS family permease